MKKILVFGAGRSAWYCIQYLVRNVPAKGWHVTVADGEQQNIDACQADFPSAETVVVNVLDTDSRYKLIKEQHVVISLMPAMFHVFIARDCIEFGVHLITPSYISTEMAHLHSQALAKKVTILNELGLDPGIDHMSTMRLVHRIKNSGATITAYKSYCGGVIANENRDNPWDYKFTWNPYNVIRAGQDGGICLQDGHFEYIPYHRLFRETWDVAVADEVFEAYLNRDATHYIDMYGLEAASTFLRGTLRYKGFGQKWNVLVNAGLTADKLKIEIPRPQSWEAYLKGFKMETGGDTSVNEAIAWLYQNAGDIALLNATPAENLQKLLETKWKMNPADTDRVVMQHEIEYEKQGQHYILKSYLDINGEDAVRTAMAKTVGLPLAIAAELIAEGRIKTFGVILPVINEVYEPALNLLAKEGIRFKETINPLSRT